AFHSGAFGAAWRGSLPILPVVVLGARRKLPSGAVLPRPGRLEVRFCGPIASETFESTKALMQGTRAAMLEQLGEHDLARAPAAADGPEHARPEKEPQHAHPESEPKRLLPESGPERARPEGGLAPPAAHICE